MKKVKKEKEEDGVGRMTKLMGQKSVDEKGKGGVRGRARSLGFIHMSACRGNRLNRTRF